MYSILIYYISDTIDYVNQNKIVEDSTENLNFFKLKWNCLSDHVYSILY